LENHKDLSEGKMILKIIIWWKQRVISS
jgi:hypothetical protein